MAAQEQDMETRNVATVIGGSGFIGRYVVKRLAAMGYIVRVAVRDPEAALFLKPMGRVGQIVPLFADMARPATLARAIDGAGVVINLVGILAERRSGDFTRIQAEAPGIVAQEAARGGTTHLIQMSAIGANTGSKAAYGRTKAAGEQAARSAFPATTILRPSIVFGPEDQFFNRFARLAQIAPVMPVIAGATRFQPVYVGDVADAVISALGRPEAAGAIYELAGPRIMTFREILGWIVAQLGRNRPLVNMPPAAARLLAGLPMSGLTHDQLLMLEQDNIADPALPGLSELGILPTPIELVVPSYLLRYRRGGVQQGEGMIVPDRT